MNEEDKHCPYHDRVRKDIDANCKAVKTKVSWTIFSLVVGALFILATGSYQYTYSTDKSSSIELEDQKQKTRISCETNSRAIGRLESAKNLDNYKFNQMNNKMDTIIDLQKKTLKQSQENKDEIQKLKWQINNE